MHLNIFKNLKKAKSIRSATDESYDQEQMVDRIGGAVTLSNPTDMKAISPYFIPEAFDAINMEPWLDSELQRFMDGKLDQYNGDVLDAAVDKKAALAERDIERQKIQHSAQIMLLNKDNSETKLIAETAIEKSTLQLGETQEELSNLKKRLNSGKFRNEVKNHEE